MEIKPKISKWGLIKLKSFCRAKGSLNEMKRQPWKWKKIIANEKNWKRINLQNIQAAHAAQYKENKQPNLRMSRPKKKHFSKEDIQMANTWKDVQHNSLLYVLFSQFSSLQSLSCVRLFATPWIARPPCPSPTRSLFKLVVFESVMPSSHLILCRPLLLLPTIPPSIRVFSNEPTLRMRWPKYWSFSFSISPSNEYSGLISFRMDWLDLLAVQGTLKSLLQHHSSKASVL